MDNNKINTQEQIDRYLLGKMDQEEKITFEKQLADDKDLHKEVELSQHIISAIQQEGEQPAFKAMQSMPEEDFKRIITSIQPVKQRTKRFMLIRISAAVAAIIFLLLYIGSRPRYSSDELYFQFYQTQPYETYPSRGGNELTIEEKIKMREAKSLYEQKEYTQALTIYNQFITDETDLKPVQEEILFHAAICQLETNNLPAAIEKLTHLSSYLSDFQDEALWNLAFAYLKANQRSKAKTCLQQLIDKDSDYASKTKELMKELDKKLWF